MERKDITVIKIGGSTFGSGDTTVEDLVALQKGGQRLVVVHGGGNTITEWLKRFGIVTRFVRGERVTDLETLRVATAVLAGLANKEIVGAINEKGGRAVGICGADGALIRGSMKNPELGYVGEVAEIEPAIIYHLIEADFLPVISPIGLFAVGRPPDAPVLLNINGDPVAGEIAMAVHAARLIFLTDVAGLIDGRGKVLPDLIEPEARKLMAEGVVSGGMIPKIEACLRALQAGTVARIIDGRIPHALLAEFEEPQGGTTFLKERRD